mmetsp:Transcript_15756/g.35080  ORF Transcript_15756/g.35080 Transcript_15756/m.35080 type:complete len:845 (+) Transcript_15756:340-2874(+)
MEQMESATPPPKTMTATTGLHVMCLDIVDRSGGRKRNISSPSIDRDEQHVATTERSSRRPSSGRSMIRVRAGNNAFSWNLGIAAAMAFVLTFHVLDGHVASLGRLLPVADAYELYDWNPTSGFSEDFPDGGDEEGNDEGSPVTVDNESKVIFYADDDNISEDMIDFDDDYVSGDATYSNGNVAGLADYNSGGGGANRGGNDGSGAAEAGSDGVITSNQNPNPPTPRPTRQPTTPRPTRRPRRRQTPSPTKVPTPSPTPDPTAEPTADPTEAPVGPDTIATDAPTEAPTTPSPTSSPTFSPTSLPTNTPTLAPTVTASASPSVTSSSSPSFVPTQAPTVAPTMSSQPSVAPTVPIPYTFAIQMTPFEITLTSMNDELDGEQLQIFNLFSDKQIEDTWLSRKLSTLSEEDAKLLSSDFVDIAFETVVTSQDLSDPIQESSTEQDGEMPNNTTDASYRTTDDTPAPTSSPTKTKKSKKKSTKKPKGTQSPTPSPTIDLDELEIDGDGGRIRRRAATKTTRQDQQEWQQKQRRGLQQEGDDIDHTSISTSTIRTLNVQQTKTAYVTLRGKSLRDSHPEIVPTANELDTAVQITYGTASSELVTVLKDFDVPEFDELHSVDFLHFFYPSTVGGVASAISGEQQVLSKGKKLSGGAIFGIFVASAIGAVLLGLAAVSLRRRKESKAHTKAASTKIKTLCSGYSDKMKARLLKRKKSKSQSPTASDLGADNFLEDQYDEAIFQYEMDSYISSLGLGGISGSFDMEPGYDSGKRGLGADGGRRKVRFQEDIPDETHLPTPTAHNRSIQSRPSNDASAGTNLDGVVYLCEKDEEQEQRSRISGEGVEGIFSTD